MSYTLPQITYDYSALEPYIDATTMNIHHTKHHQAYVTKLNDGLPVNTFSHFKDKSMTDIVEVCRNASTLPTIVRNNGILWFYHAGGGHYNHSLFWTWMAPVGTSNTAPTGELKAKIEDTWGSVDAMKSKFNDAAATQFGSGWAWLGVKSDGQLAICSTPNQGICNLELDNPLMANIATCPMIPVLGLDVWEHAYYLKYQNRRPEYIAQWWNVVNWDKVVEYYDKFASKGVPVPAKLH